MPDIRPGSLPFQEAIDAFRSKLDIPSQHWDDLLGEVHAKAFTIAGATQADLLADLRSAVDQAITDGTTITDFRKRFDQAVADHGWTYKGQRGWRTRVIYDTNLRTARMAGKWDQFQRTKENRPYLQYQTVGDARVRPEHAAWDERVLSVDDPWWNTHYPPNGWGCRCTVRSLSDQQLQREGLSVSEAPPVETTERINTGSGEIYGEVPQGIDTGWDYNVGKAWLGPDVAFGEKLMGLPTGMRTAALENAQALAPHLEKTFSPWVNRLLTRKQPLGEIRTVGYLSPRQVEELIRRGQPPTTAVITATDKDVMHLLRDAKDGKHIPADMVRSLPEHITQPRAVLWDKRDPALVYVFDIPGEQRDGKVVVRVNYRVKGQGPDGERRSLQTNSVRTGGLVQVRNLADGNIYDLVEGEL
jgi:SPP1 gp7 family putative phage head morphogenesis protein